MRVTSALLRQPPASRILKPDDAERGGERTQLAVGVVAVVVAVVVVVVERRLPKTRTAICLALILPARTCCWFPESHRVRLLVWPITGDEAVDAVNC